METKICVDCKEEKAIDEFKQTFNKSRGYLYTHTFCKDCYKKRKQKWDKTYREKHKDKLKAKRDKEREKYKEYCKEWHKRNKEREKEYRKNHLEHKNKKQQEWTSKNIDKVRKYHKLYKRKVRSNELVYAKDRIRNMINTSFRRKKYSKNTKTYKILGADYKTVWEHLKQTWFKNYGKEYNNEAYEIDHIIPLSNATTYEEIIQLCHYTNLQLLTPEDNLKKGNKVETHIEVSKDEIKDRK